MQFLRNTYLSGRFFVVLTGIIIWFCFSFFLPKIYWSGIVMLFALSILTIIDWVWQFGLKNLISVDRKMPSMLSLGDENKIELIVKNHSNFKWKLEIIDELPFQFQIRNFLIHCRLLPHENRSLFYFVRPVNRGEYHFGQTLVFVKSKFGLVKRRLQTADPQTAKVYPSIMQMKKFELYSSSKLAKFYGIKKLKRIGLSYEFEQIKNYIRGDDTRHINWKATGRHQKLMVNQFEDEKSQAVYNIIDKSRIMLLPFQDQSLMDYAINTSLVISNVALRKHDKVGLISFADKIGSVIKADSKHLQMKLILETLYNQKEKALEANFELLYLSIKNMIKTRSLMFIYTNFESLYGLHRVLPILRKINQHHLLIIVFFKNNEIEQFSRKNIDSLRDAYTNVLAEQSMIDKHVIAQELNNHGIQTILTSPEELSLNSINKYIELKARGMI